jgi:hypothetical protein
MRHIEGTILRRGALLSILATAALLLGGCATRAPAHDYSAFLKAKPASLLVLPPVNDSPDIKATPGVWSHATRPLSEAGYYVLPVTLVDETLKGNGIQTAADAQEIPYQKLREVFGADAAVYIKVARYGTSYKVIDSETRVDVEGRIIDLRNGDLLWAGKAFSTSAEQSQQSQGGLVGLLVTAVIKQIVGTATDAAYNQAGIAQARLLGAPRYNGVLPGPRSPLAGQVPAPPQ